MNALASRLAKIRDNVEFDHFARIALLEEPQFTNQDVEACCHVSSTQLHNWVSRGWIKLSHANPGKGKRRLYTGNDAIAVAVAAALLPYGMMQVAEQLVRVNMVAGRTGRLLREPEYPGEYALAIVPSPDGDDWLYINLYDDNAPKNPTPACVVLDIDLIIIETLENLLLVMDGQPVAQREWPKKPTPQESEDEFLESMGQAYRDENGQRIWRGLTIEESIEYQRLKDADWSNRTSGAGERLTPAERARSIELSERNHIATARHNFGEPGDD